MPASPSSARIPVEERLFSLVLALVATETGLTKNDILSTVQGYRQRYSDTGDNASLERQFERDKDDIRDLGIPLETVEPPGEESNNRSTRYRIPKGEYDLPDDIRFSPAELALLSLAAGVWREGSLAAESHRALVKLRSLGVESTDPVVGIAPRLRIQDPAFEPLSLALEHHKVVAFSYMKPGDHQAEKRSVEPLALVRFQSRWHLYGIDRLRRRERTFLLSRITSAVTVTSTSFTPADGEFATQAMEELDRLWRQQVAVVRVQPGSDAAQRLGRRPGSQAMDETTLRLHDTDIYALADELAGFGPEVLVREPAELRRLVHRRLAAVHRAHAQPEESDE